MPQFQYRAVTPEGEERSGALEAGDQGAAVLQLQRSGLIPISVEEGGAAGLPNLLQLKLQLGGASQRRVLQFTLDLATLMRAGVSLDRALEIMRRVAGDEGSQSMLAHIQEGVRKGQALSAVLKEQGGDFSRFYISMVHAAEMSGSLGDGLTDLAHYMERSRELREKTLSALLYPLILLVVAGLSLLIILTYVVPQFQQLFDDMGRALPLSTSIVIGIAEFIRDVGPWLLLAVIVAALWFRRRLQDPEVRLRWDAWLLRLPLAGGLLQRLDTARFSRSLGTLVRGGVPLLTALQIARETLVNQTMAEGADTAAASLKEGRRLAEPLQATGVFPTLALQMIQVGEETGQLDEMLLKVADVYDREVANAVQRMLTILEPVLIVGLGLMIAGIILSILVAIMSINELPI
ncbi:type II secretion system protein GspF [Marinobacterium nitratireducens]|uniref:Type II secretion system protein GspF n=1 Tax=Marinobacterium nitratireducens TaxID=518897 RepID=A0A917ZC67_9GAMM|nr:type II secretion system F family protein [Marinobacterium nitratireducens]GGO80161.1 type II secretion system protein GspF [Marinobacterium nitratireducens]